MNEITLWNQVLTGAMKIPFVKVDRASFLCKELALYCNSEELNKIVVSSPVGIVDSKIINKLANGCINYHLTTVTATSALAGIPGGWWAAGTIPADITQFYAHVLCLSQKLMYLYGWPDITNEDGNIDDGTAQILTLFVGVMLGQEMARQALITLEKEFAKQIVKRLPQIALTKYAIYNITKQVAKWIGIKLTKKQFAQWVGKAVPIIGAPISGSLTYWTFKPMSKRLKKHLENSWELQSENLKL